VISAHPEVAQAKKSGFGSGLRVNGKVFAMPSKGRLVIKLPQDRIDELIQQGKGEPYVYGEKIVKGWMVVISEADWKNLVLEALDYNKNIK
jgi:TfoX/Sxy family transcriptional regulator of competence genes